MKDLVVKSNKLIQALQTLNLSETRLLQLSIIDARETGQGLTSEQPLTLSASRYSQAFGITLDAAYLALIEAEETLFKRQFTVLNDDGTFTKSRWIQDANYRKGEGCILVTLTRVVVEHVTKIDGFQEYFTSYYLTQTANLKSVYAVRLYELIIQWKSVGKTPILELKKLRDQLGVGCNEYLRMEAFKRRILDIAVQQINLYSDIKVIYTQEKKGRKISGFSFEIKKDKNTDSSPNKLTQKQISFLAKKLAEDSIVGGAFATVGESKKDFEIRIANELKDPNKLLQYKKHFHRFKF